MKLSNVFNTESLALGAIGFIVGTTVTVLTGGTAALIAVATLAGGAAGSAINHFAGDTDARYQAHLAHMEKVSNRPVGENIVVGKSYDSSTWTGLKTVKPKAAFKK